MELVLIIVGGSQLVEERFGSGLEEYLCSLPTLCAFSKISKADSTTSPALGV